MSTTLAEVHHADGFISPELRTIARHTRKTGATRWYRAHSDGEEVAFLAIERTGQRFVLHQLVVPRAIRGLGFGSAVLQAVEDLAQYEGVGSVRVWPRPLDNRVDQGDLELWYRDRGYWTVADGTGDREKHIVPVVSNGDYPAFGELNRGVQVIAAEWSDYFKRLFDNSAKTLGAVIGAKSVEDAIDVQTQYANNAYEAHVAEIQKLGDMYANLIRAAYGLQAR